MSELPRWVWDLVADLLDEEEIHPKLFFTSGAFVGYRQYDWCPSVPLARVPEDVMVRARAIAGYRERPTDPAPAVPEEGS